MPTEKKAQSIDRLEKEFSKAKLLDYEDTAKAARD